MNNKSEESFYFYDLETFGINPTVDRIAQFAGVRTNLNLEPIEEPLILYCKITPDFLPDPISCTVTGISPQDTLEKGLPEVEFIKQINDKFSKPRTCVVGYNSIKFDDEFIRNALYRNLLDPYMREWNNGNSRWDLINVVRMTHDLRPNGIVWPKNEDGSDCFRLEKLTEANGISHENAHDAMADVWATIAVAKLIKEKQPKIFNYLYNLRSKKNLMPFMDFGNKKPCLYTDTQFRTEYGSTTVIVPVAYDYINRNKIYCCDLSRDVQALIDLSVDELRDLYFSHFESRGERLDNINLFPIEINKSPAISVLQALRPQDAERLHINLNDCMNRFQQIKQNEQLTIKLISIFSNMERTPYKTPDNSDPDYMIYSGDFFNDHDRVLMQAVHNTEPDKILETKYGFDDPRLPEMVWRFVCRNYPEALNDVERMRWQSFCASRLCLPTGGRINDINFYFRKIEEKAKDKDISPKGKAVLPALLEYGKKLQKDVLGFNEEDKK